MKVVGHVDAVVSMAFVIQNADYACDLRNRGVAEAFV